MINKITKVLSIAAVLVVSVSMAHINTLNIKGGETFTPGAKQTISWVLATAHGSSFSISYSKDGGTTWAKVVDNLPLVAQGATASYSWTIPTETTTKGMIWVNHVTSTPPNLTGADYNLKSGVFTVGPTSSINTNNTEIKSTLAYNTSTQSIAVAYSLVNNENVTLEAFDASGKLLVTLLNQNQNAGAYNQTISTQQIVAKGQIIFKLKVGNEVLAEKSIAR